MSENKLNIIEFGAVPTLPSFRFALHDKPGGKGRRHEFELPNLSSETLPWDLIPLALAAVQEGTDGLKRGAAAQAVYSYLGRKQPELVAHLVAIGDHASETLNYILERWVAHSQIDPKAEPSQS